jgi:HEXXH motif-containing protein
VPRDLTVPEPGSTTARDVLSRAVGRLMVELLPLLKRHVASAPDDVAAVEHAIVALGPRAAAPMASILRRSHAGALVRTLRSTPPGQGAELLTVLLSTLAFDLAYLGVLAEPIVLRRTARVVSLVARSVASPDGRVEHPFHPIDDDSVLALADANPLAMNEAHPDKQGNAIDLGGRPVDEWLASLRSALDVVSTYLPDLRSEMRLYVQAVVPVGYFPDRHLSASYREAIGTLYVSLHPDLMTMVEALVHEFQHNKLNALLELDEVLTNPPEATYASPVRPDPRPLHGVLLAVHAFVPVARLYERMIEAGDTRARPDRWRAVVRMNREGMEVLRAHARPTPVGQGLMDELERWDACFAHC